MSVNFKIHNMILSTSVNRPVKLDRLSLKLDKSEYEPEQFPGLVYRTESPKSGVLLFSSGRLNIVGVKNIREGREVLSQIVKILDDNGFEVKNKSKLKVENIVASAKIAKEINLDKIGFEFENTEYEPEQFPGLIYRMTEPKLVFLLFSSGRIVCVGSTKTDDIKKGIAKLLKQIKPFSS